LDKKKAYNENKVATIIGQGTELTGDITSKGTIRIEGTVRGRVNCEDTIVVYETGRVKADLVAGQIIISGHVEGNVFAHDRLEVTSRARLIGNVMSPRVSITEGVVFEGQCSMKPAGEAKPPVFDEPIVQFPNKSSENVSAV
jgi:cytoskeletal protein CcmA (bactofilin family)